MNLPTVSLNRSSARGRPASALFLLAFVFLLGCVACDGDRSGGSDPAGTPELRAALFDSIVAMTERREAWSELKNEALSFDPLEEMRALRDTVVGAETGEELFYALARLSHARRDRHLDVALVPGGVSIPDSAGVDVWSGPAAAPPLEAPIRVLPDYSEEVPAYFVADVAEYLSGPDGPQPGDRIIAVNGLPVAEYEEAVRPYMRHSSIAGLRWKVAEAMTRRSATFPPALRSDALQLEVERADGTSVSLALSYLQTESLVWSGVSEPRYPGFSTAHSTPTYDLLLPNDGRPVIILLWHRFESSLKEDIDGLMAMAESRGLLDHALLFDATRSGGGSLGAYALQRLQGRAFKTTFGTLRLSDVIEPFVQEKQEEFEDKRVYDSGGPETIDDGTWLMDWLEDDVMADLARGESVTEPVPFKLAHAPKGSDGVLEPTPVHFRGPMVVFSGPNGGSHLDQFISIVADNNLAPIIGMPAGGYSNTWEWEEVLTFPGTDRPVVGFMWSIGHTVRPNGEILEGNPAPVDEWVPLTAENFDRYYQILYDRALAHLGEQGHPAGREAR